MENLIPTHKAVEPLNMADMGFRPCLFDMLLFDYGRSRTSEIALTTRAIARAYRIRPQLRSTLSFTGSNRNYTVYASPLGDKYCSAGRQPWGDVDVIN